MGARASFRTSEPDGPGADPAQALAANRGIEGLVAELALGRLGVVCLGGRLAASAVVANAAAITGDQVNFMARYAGGLVQLVITPARAKALGVTLQTHHRARRLGRRFGVSIEAATGVTTGISAEDRATTIRVAMDPGAAPADLVSPGHVFPVIARRRRAGQAPCLAEHALQIARLAGAEAVVICELLDEGGDVASVSYAQAFARGWGLPFAGLALAS